ncbi:hypothetical protein N665_0099s0001 [Sinapis alba]|nr:hypothetical protein N665_0099s0001 [Sinapis alba]KAF8109249.1 hypothetical protein N665_0099s0001 [Sinapis alba]
MQTQWSLTIADLILALLIQILGATCVKFGPDAKYVAVGSMDHNFRIFGLPSNESTEDCTQDS